HLAAAVLAVGGGGPSERRPAAGAWMALVALERVDDGLEGVLDLRAERAEHDHDGDGDQGEDDAVLGHGLALLALPVVLDPLNCELEHLCFPLRLLFAADEAIRRR